MLLIPSKLIQYENFNKPIKVGINGAGRIGRHLIRQICNDKKFNYL